MRIVQAVGWFYPDSVGGTEVYVSALSRELQAHGHEVLIAAPQAGLQAPRTYEHDGCSVFRYPIPSSPTRDEAQGDVVVRGAEQFHRWLASVRADVVHLHTFVTGLGLNEVCAARDAGSHVVVTTHASSLGYICQRGTLMWRGETLCDGRVDAARCADCVLQRRGAPAFARVALASLALPVRHAGGMLPGRIGTALGMTDLIERNMRRQRAMFESIDAFVVLTDRAAEIVRANGAPRNKVAVNRLGVRNDIVVPAAPPRLAPDGVVRVGYVGRFEDVKGVVDLAEAMRRVPPDVPIRLELRGPAQTASDRDVRARVLELTASDPRVTIADGVSPPHVLDLLRTYDVLCCPSRCLEGGPTVALEAMAAGVPVVAASVGGVAEVVQNGVNARLITPGAVDQLTDALVEIARNPRTTIREWRRRLPAPRTMRDVAMDYLSLYSGGARELAVARHA
jgi:glycosyltransferase involved in cell wall biosynthesis